MHLLHSAGGVFDRDNTPIADLVLHYSDGSEHVYEIVNAEHVRDWWGPVSQTMSGENSELAWSGTNPALEQYGSNGAIRIYRTNFENPAPAKQILSIDYISKMNDSSPFLLGLTLEKVEE